MKPCEVLTILVGNILIVLGEDSRHRLISLHSGCHRDNHEEYHPDCNLEYLEYPQCRCEMRGDDGTKQDLKKTESSISGFMYKHAPLKAPRIPALTKANFVDDSGRRHANRLGKQYK